MKLPFDLGIKLVFRLLVPGFLLLLGLIPILNTALRWAGWDVQREYVYVLTVILAGWLVVILDMQIFMLFEGRRYLPARLAERLRTREEKRCARLQQFVDSYLDGVRRGAAQTPARERKYLESLVELRNFPVDDDGRRKAELPTRLGNLLRSYEGYSMRVYGMSAVFYWPRLWLKLNKDLREEIDSNQAIADSTVYAPFALGVSGLLWLAYALGTTLRALITRSPGLKGYLPAARANITEHLPAWHVCWLLAAAFFLLAFLIYRFSFHLHARAGDFVKSAFDDFQDQIDVTPVINGLAEGTGVAAFTRLRRREQLATAWRYLQYNLVTCPGCGTPMPPNEFKRHQCSRPAPANDA